MIETLVGLQNEHRNLARIAGLLDTRAAERTPPDTAGLALITDAVYYLTHFPDAFHHPREEVLARWLERQGVLPKVLLDTLATQHHALAAQGRDLLRDLESLLRIETETWEGLAPRLLAYAEALRQNMATEEERLLPIAFAETLEAPHAVPADLGVSGAQRKPDPLDLNADDRFAQLRAVIIAEAQCACDHKPAVTYSPLPEGTAR